MKTKIMVHHVELKWLESWNILQSFKWEGRLRKTAIKLCYHEQYQSWQTWGQIVILVAGP